MLEPECPEPKYYPFTESDKKWQQFAPETQWVFRNQRDEQRTYRVARVENEAKKPNWVSGSQVEYLDYYLDYWYMTVQRTDSVSQGGSVVLKRIPVYQHYDRSELSYQFNWVDFIGRGGYLNFGQDLAATKFHSSTVRGITYTHVTRFQASSNEIMASGNFRLRPKTVQLDYDQAAGVIRFVTLNGDVWERMP